MSGTNSERFAIYFTFAATHPLYQRATQWIGHCLYNQLTQEPGAFSQGSEKFRSVQQAAMYGFHATLKPPFRLQDGTTGAGLEKHLQDFSSVIQPFTCSPLEVNSIGNFIALVPGETCDELNYLASQCVQEFERFRAPLNETEMQKRLRLPLTARQLALLRQWGYPYVLDEFRFHMTLTDGLPVNMIEAAQRQLAFEVSSLIGSCLQIDRICLCHQTDPAGRFYLRRTFLLGEKRESGEDAE